ncbi:MAG: hypothetical protein OJF52_002836 [Nitrospira sp.]|nr:MAG: hypothetical protein OJF52_002836 [Nitrospira sp.]
MPGYNESRYRKNRPTLHPLTPSPGFGLLFRPPHIGLGRIGVYRAHRTSTF